MNTASALGFDAITSWPVLGSGEGAGRVAVCEGSFPQSWAQGRATFGGAVAATAHRLCRTLVDPQRRALTLDCAFLGPVVPEQPARCEARVLREGKYLTTVEATTSQGGQVCARTLLSFGLPRASDISIAPPPRTLPPRTGEPIPHIEGLTPTFLQHLELTWMEGGYPYSGVKEAVIGGYCRHRTAASGVEAVIGLVDAWPGPMLPLMDGPGIASSVRWALHFSDLSTFHASEPTYFDSRVVMASDGYATTTGHLYDHHGKALAWTEQLVAFFALKK